MVVRVRAQELLLPLAPFAHNSSSNPNPNFNNNSFSFSMRTFPCSTFTLFRSLTLSLSNLHRRNLTLTRQFPRLSSASGASVRVEEAAFDSYSDEVFQFDRSCAAADMKHLAAPEVEVKELSEVPEQWRRARVAWLCKELPAHKAGTLVRILNAQKKWMRQEDATYVAVHCMRIRENETGFRKLYMSLNKVKVVYRRA